MWPLFIYLFIPFRNSSAFFVFVSVYVWHAVANLHKSICREKSIYEKWLPDILINGNDSDNDNDYDNGPALSQMFYLRFRIYPK